MSDAEEIWRRKTDDQVIAAAMSLDDYTDEGRRIIAAEITRRELHVGPLLQATDAIRHQPVESAHARACAFCGTATLFGGIQEGATRYCSQDCRSRALLLVASQEIPQSVVEDELRKLHSGPCPECGGPGPVEVHTSYRVYSAMVMTRWGSRVLLGCDRCGNRARKRAIALSLTCGWWGIPWGPIMTLIQLQRNWSGLRRTADISRPSKQLEVIVRQHLVRKLVSGELPRIAEQDLLKP